MSTVSVFSGTPLIQKGPPVGGPFHIYNHKKMKILPKTRLENAITAVDLTPACDSSILKINDRTFAFCSEVDPHPHLVIESEIFALLMQRLENRVVHFTVFRPRCLCCDGEGDLVIRLTEDDGCVYQLDENDNLEICMTLEDLYNRRNERNASKFE